MKMLRGSGYKYSACIVLSDNITAWHACIGKNSSFIMPVSTCSSNDRNANLTVHGQLVLYAKVAHWHF